MIITTRFRWTSISAHRSRVRDTIRLSLVIKASQSSQTTYPDFATSMVALSEHQFPVALSATYLQRLLKLRCPITQ